MHDTVWTCVSSATQNPDTVFPCISKMFWSFELLYSHLMKHVLLENLPFRPMNLPLNLERFSSQSCMNTRWYSGALLYPNYMPKIYQLSPCHPCIWCSCRMFVDLFVFKRPISSVPTWIQLGRNTAETGPVNKIPWLRSASRWGPRFGSRPISQNWMVHIGSEPK